MLEHCFAQNNDSSGWVQQCVVYDAILGCDTTYGTYRIGKKAAVKLASTSSPFRGYAQIFNDPQASKADLIYSGEDTLVALYKDRPGDKLDLLRLQKFYQTVIVSKYVVGPKVHPQTSAPQPLTTAYVSTSKFSSGWDETT